MSDDFKLEFTRSTMKSNYIIPERGTRGFQKEENYKTDFRNLGKIVCVGCFSLL